MSDVRKSHSVINKISVLIFILITSFIQCKKSSTSSTPPDPTPPPASSFDIVARTVNSISFNSTQTLYGISNSPGIQISFSDKVDRNTVSSAISYNNKTQNSANVAYTISYQNNDS